MARGNGARQVAEFDGDRGLRAIIRQGCQNFMRTDPLAFLADELSDLKAQGLYRRLRVLATACGADGLTAARYQSSSNNYLG